LRCGIVLEMVGHSCDSGWLRVVAGKESRPSRSVQCGAMRP
jgi:hypothetical protein